MGIFFFFLFQDPLPPPPSLHPITTTPSPEKIEGTNAMYLWLPDWPSFCSKPTLLFSCRKWKKITQKSINQWYNSKIHTQAHTPHTHVHTPLHFTLGVGGGGGISSNIFCPVTFPWFSLFGSIEDVREKNLMQRSHCDITIQWLAFFVCFFGSFSNIPIASIIII